MMSNWALERFPILFYPVFSLCFQSGAAGRLRGFLQRHEQRLCLQVLSAVWGTTLYTSAASTTQSIRTRYSKHLGVRSMPRYVGLISKNKQLNLDFTVSLPRDPKWILLSEVSEIVLFGFSGAEECRSGSFPRCSRSAGQQAEEQIHQHPPLWVAECLLVTRSIQSGLKLRRVKFTDRNIIFLTGSEPGFSLCSVFWSQRSGCHHLCYLHVWKNLPTKCWNVEISSLQTTSVGSSWCRCTTTKDQTTSTATTYLWASACSLKISLSAFLFPCQ